MGALVMLQEFFGVTWRVLLVNSPPHASSPPPPYHDASARRYTSSRPSLLWAPRSSVSTAKRSRLAPDIPTIAESGIAGFDASLWYGTWVPKGTPKDIVARLNAVMVETLADPAVTLRFNELGLDMPAREQQTPEALRAFQKAEADKWWPIIKAANIKGQ